MFNHKEYQRKWREAHPEYHKKWFKNNEGKYKEKQKSSFLMKKYGLSAEQYNQMFIEQGGRCKICNKHQSEFKRSLAVDHSHETNKIRGLLCHHCNGALGHFFEDISVMEKAILYLRESSFYK